MITTCSLHNLHIRFDFRIEKPLRKDSTKNVYLVMCTAFFVQGECCATCGSPNVTGRGCSFGSDATFHPEGSRWHPYIPPFGFSRCAVCRCQVSRNNDAVDQPLETEHCHQAEISACEKMTNAFMQLHIMYAVSAINFPVRESFATKDVGSYASGR